ncbi:MAG: DEAD/DEAH box helicase [Deltaproteobacteria bacterium]|nr:MAG: DEAD/DEAH box helicase [Deltaproteobacteria bacterium]
MSVFPRFAPRLREAIVARLGWTSLRPVQDEAGNALLDGKNAVILAPTAGGKTEAALFPTLSALLDDEPAGVGAIYLAPIKALLNNQARRLGQYTEMVGLTRFVWHGDVSAAPRKRFLAEPATVLMTTPESLEVMLMSPRVDTRALFGDLRVVIVDEIHALAGTDRGAHMMSVIERLAALSRHDVQRVGLSATVGNPDAILGWLGGSSARDGVIVDPPKGRSQRELLALYEPSIEGLARRAARMARGGKSLFFCQSRAATELVAEHVGRADVEVFVHHSAVSKEERELAEERFHGGGAACIVCTSTLELGIDVGDLDRVLQSDAPDTVGSFLQRMGRTGRRAGQVANTTFFCESVDALVQAVALVELAREGWVEEVAITDRCWPVLVHQLLALALAEEGVTRESAWRRLARVPDFRGIRRAEYERLVTHLVETEALYEASGRLVVGREAEKRFGRRNFMELYAVFSSPKSYDVRAPGDRPVGTLSQDFVDRLVDEVSSFLLGGRAWVVDEIDHKLRRVKVSPAPRGRQPSWGGMTPQFLGYELCQQMKVVLASDAEPSWLGREARVALADRRAEVAEVVHPEGDGLEELGGEVRWWTFAGGRINVTLKRAIDALGTPWKVAADNLRLVFRGDDELSLLGVRAVIARLASPEPWGDEQLWREIAEGLPAFRLSKFQSLMPTWIEREVVATYLLDVDGAREFAAGRPRTEVDRRRLPPMLLAALGELAEAPAADDVSGVEVAGAFEPSRPVVWVDSDAALTAAVADLLTQRIVGLDVETTLFSRELCLIQLATGERTYVIDPLVIADLSPLAPMLASPNITKAIHNAAFERDVFGRYGFVLDGVFDTQTAARAARPGATGGHGLAAVCARELGIRLNKREQKSNWLARPLTASQLAYAAVDAEVLVPLFARFESVVTEPPTPDHEVEPEDEDGGVRSE